ncbi:hypothetical protein NDU88_012647 [Pleurodeles waltl]|uniref:Uncharacterized protein n=1 Tax=Pleurodeles waltl TaxID=8319 RepID=A0AAV7R289_PLEWA|nr:hypothetical protein NDU88_012647 [Pleurodeles waltl]
MRGGCMRVQAGPRAEPGHRMCSDALLIIKAARKVTAEKEQAPGLACQVMLPPAAQQATVCGACFPNGTDKMFET